MTLSRHILAILARIEPHGLTAPTLRDELRVKMGRLPGETDVADTLFRLGQQGYVARERDDLTDDERWAITREGLKK